jgi:E3 ubiquitin-protein ligase HERC2
MGQGRQCCAGEVNAWGCNLQGQCGIPATVDIAEPSIVHALLAVPIVEVAAGLNHTLARSASGDVYSWGSGDCGQLGHSTTCNEAVPRLLEAFDLERHEVASIACGSRRDAITLHHFDHSLAGL